MEQEGADVLFTDLRMPDMNGVDLISQVKLKSPETECIIVSAYSDFDVARKALAYRAAGYILKPLNRGEVADLVKRIRTVLDGKNRDTLLLDPQNSQSVEMTLNHLDKEYRNSCCCVLLSPVPHDIQGVSEGSITGIKIQGSSLFVCLYAQNERRLPAWVTGDQKSWAQSRWHEHPRDLIQMLREASAAGCGAFSYVEHPIVSAIQFHIGYSPDADISIKTISELFFISENYLGELFKKHAGETLIDFTKKVRLFNACRLLEYSDLVLKNIAYRTGFTDYGYFGHCFKIFSSLMPKVFRTRYRNSGESFRPDFFLSIDQEAAAEKIDY
jgi:two-component system response regulator YesN